MRHILVLLVFVASVPIGAHTGGMQEFTCPICTGKFEAYVAMSGTSFGARLDFKKLGPIASPWPVPRCTHCGFVIYQKALDDDLKKKLKDFVLGEAYAGSWKRHTNYHCMGLILEACTERTPMNLGFIFLQATWELEDDDQRYPAYAAKAIACFAAMAEPPVLPAEGEPEEAAKKARADFLVARYLQVELHRRSKAFEEATKVLGTIAELDRRGAPDWYDKAVEYQAALVINRDTAPHTFGDLPKDEEAPAGKQEAKDGE